MRILARGHAGERKAVRQIHRHVFERVYGDVGRTIVQRDFEFLDKQTFTADFGQTLIENLVAARGGTENLDRHIGIKRTQAVTDVVRLPHGQARFAGNDGDNFRRVGMNGVGHVSL